MRLVHAAVVLLALTAVACDGGDDDDDDDRATRVEFSDFESGEFARCEVIGSVVNDSSDRVCDVFLQYEARDFDDDVFATTIVNVEDLVPDEVAEFGAALLDGNGEFVSCSDVDRIELVEHDEFCD